MYERTLARDPGDERAVLHYTEALSALRSVGIDTTGTPTHQRQRAVEILKLAVAQEPNNLQLLQLLGREFNSLGQYEEAKAVFEKLIAICDGGTSRRFGQRVRVGIGIGIGIGISIGIGIAT